MAVGDGRQALDILAGEAVDLVLMDCQMPELDGFAATAALREREAGSDNHLPVIAVTANAMKGDRERCAAAGMDDYLAKPYTGEELLAVLARWLPAERRKAPPAPVPPSAGGRRLGAPGRGRLPEGGRTGMGALRTGAGRWRCGAAGECGARAEVEQFQCRGEWRRVDAVLQAVLAGLPS